MPTLTALIDGYSLLYRAYHALATPMNAPDGTPTGAIMGFMMMLTRVLEQEKPDQVIAAFDPHGPSFRKGLFDGYKATRKPMPDDLRAQDPIVRQLIGLMGIPIVEVQGFEADDVIGTLSLKIAESGGEALIVTGDRDSFQLAGEGVSILYTKRGVSDTALVTPDYIRETYGVTPRQMIDVKSLMGDASDNIPGIAGIGEKTALKLVAESGDLESVLASAPRQKGKLAERLAQGAQSARMSYALAQINRQVPLSVPASAVNPAGAIGRIRELGMRKVAEKLSHMAGSAPETAAPATEEASTVTLLSDLSALRDAADAAPDLPSAIYADDRFSLAREDGNFVLPLGGGDLLSGAVTVEDAFSAAGKLLRGKGEKAVYDVKSLPFPPEEMGGSAFDAKLAAYVIAPQRPSFSLNDLCAQEGIPWQPDCPAASLARLAEKEKGDLAQSGTERVYEKIEFPLSLVLRNMEETGFLVDAGVLEELRTEFSRRIAEAEDTVYSLAGERVNINSPKQLSELLYDRLGLPAPRGKSRSTDAETLESLSSLHPVSGAILEYRKYKKLLSTYVEALLRLRGADGRVRTSFDQVSTATGRISSLEPNLQNIPVRTPLGREIRRAFVAQPGWVLVDADYSQIELRVLSHISGDETMRQAFLSGEDIHARTAAEVYGLDPANVTPEMRSRAKAVNFGIVYGISDFTLARNTGSTRQEAREFMDRYFDRYPGVRRYMTESVEAARSKGYCETLMGRRRYLPELASDVHTVRAFGERCAMNSPIQGTAADIIKLAMIRADEALRARGLASRLILQVHDELIVECPLAEADEAESLLRAAMEGVLSLSVPLSVEISRGRNWCECK